MGYQVSLSHSARRDLQGIFAAPHVFGWLIYSAHSAKALRRQAPAIWLK
jgi:hypothetical protein